MNTENRSEFLRGMRHGWPIGVGYFGVAFALGIAARNAGFSALQAGVMSAVCTASAGEFAGVTVAAASGTFLEMALIELVVNARYLLMSCALTQKLSPKLGWIAGTVLGVIMGNVLPANVVSALSVGLYGMFLAIIIPPTRTNHVLAGLVPVSMAISWIFTKLNDAGILPLSSGNRIILLTVAISLAAAALFPHDDPEDPAAGDAGKEAA